MKIGRDNMHTPVEKITSGAIYQHTLPLRYGMAAEYLVLSNPLAAHPPIRVAQQ